MACSRRQFLTNMGWGAAALGALPFGARAQTRRRPPNVLFILADDLGWRDTGVYGSRFYRTPNIDRLAKRGMLFTDAYAANPLCSPTRASILTGQYPGRLRFTTPAGHLKQEVLDPKLPEAADSEHRAVTPGTRTRLPNDYVTYAEILKQAGYTTAFMGKWHLGRAPYLPDNQGFDVVVGGREHPGPPGGYFAPWRCSTLPVKPEGTHICDTLTDEALAFLAANKERPFLLNLWYYDVHAPFQGKEDLIAQYRERINPEDPQRCPTMGAMIEVMDQNIGRVIDELDRLGLIDDTIIVFTSDNGGNMYNTVDETTPTSNAPLRNGKGNIHEGGVRVPLMVVWPGVVRPGSRSGEVVTSVDYYPTLLDILGLAPPRGTLLDGISIVPALKGGRLDRQAIFCHFPHYVPATGNLPSTSVRQGDWKLIRFFCDGPQQEDRYGLYNLAEDIGEQDNLAGSMPAKVAELSRLVERHLEDTKALVPFKNPAYGPPVGGWSSNRYAKIKADGGTLRLTSAGNDPWIKTGDVPDMAAPGKVVIRMKAASKGKGQFFWSTAKTRPFHRSRSAMFDVKHDGAWHDYTLDVAPDSAVRAFRFDPCQAPGDVEIQFIRVLSGSGDVLREWRFDAAEEH